MKYKVFIYQGSNPGSAANGGAGFTFYTLKQAFEFALEMSRTRNFGGAGNQNYNTLLWTGVDVRWFYDGVEYTG